MEVPEGFRVCNYCGGTGLDDMPEWSTEGQEKLFNWSIPEGMSIPPRKQLCYGCHGRKFVPDCPWCKKPPEVVECGTCKVKFELSPMCLSRLAPLVGGHIKRGAGSLFVQPVDKGPITDFCSEGCKEAWKAGAGAGR